MAYLASGAAQVWKPALSMLSGHSATSQVWNCGHAHQNLPFCPGLASLCTVSPMVPAWLSWHEDSLHKLGSLLSVTLAQPLLLQMAPHSHQNTSGPLNCHLESQSVPGALVSPGQGAKGPRDAQGWNGPWLPPEPAVNTGRNFVRWLLKTGLQQFPVK